MAIIALYRLKHNFAGVRRAQPSGACGGQLNQMLLNLPRPTALQGSLPSTIIPSLSISCMRHNESKSGDARRPARLYPKDYSTLRRPFNWCRYILARTILTRPATPTYSCDQCVIMMAGGLLCILGNSGWFFARLDTSLLCCGLEPLLPAMFLKSGNHVLAF